MGGLAALLTAVMLSQTPFDLQGHRGARGHAPENTLPGFERALAIGVDTLELDVGVTRDGVVVIHHDRRLNPDLARGPDGNWVAAPAPHDSFSRPIRELQRYDVGRLRPGSEYAQRFPHQKPVDGTRDSPPGGVVCPVKLESEIQHRNQAGSRSAGRNPRARSLSRAR